MKDNAHSTTEHPATQTIVLRGGLWMVGFAILWAVLSGGQLDSWLVGLPAVLSAGLVAGLIGRPEKWRCSLIGLLNFAPYFLVSSLTGGWDVAWRSLRPQLPVDPGMVEYRLQLPEGTPRVFFINVVGLLPGTVCVSINNNVALIHAIDKQEDIGGELRRLEKLVASLFLIEFGNDLLKERND